MVASTRRVGTRTSRRRFRAVMVAMLTGAGTVLPRQAAVAVVAVVIGCSVPRVLAGPVRRVARRRAGRCRTERLLPGWACAARARRRAGGGLGPVRLAVPAGLRRPGL